MGFRNRLLNKGPEHGHFELEVGNRYGHSTDNFAIPLTPDEEKQFVEMTEGEQAAWMSEHIVNGTSILFEGFLERMEDR